MTTDQINSLIRSLFKIAGAALLAHGSTQAAGLVNSEAIIGAVITLAGLFASWNWHKPDAPKPPGGSGPGAALLILAAAFVLCSGCVATNPAHQTDPSAPAYVVDPRIQTTQATAQTVAAVAAPILAATPAAPLAPFVPPLTNVIFSALTLISGIFAWYKNRQANQATAAANALAATIPATAHPAALANAATNGSTAEVAKALQYSQSPT